MFCSFGEQKLRKLGEKLFKQILLKKLQMQLLGKTFFNVKLFLQFDRQPHNLCCKYNGGLCL